MESGVYIIEAREVAGMPFPVAAVAVNAEQNYTIYSRIMFPPEVVVTMAAHGIDPVMFDFNLN